MTRYYVNTQAQTNGDHEVHTASCSFLPAAEHRKDLGEFSNCHEAVAVAKQTYPQADGCYHCCRACHTG